MLLTSIRLNKEVTTQDKKKLGSVQIIDLQCFSQSPYCGNNLEKITASNIPAAMLLSFFVEPICGKKKKLTRMKIISALHIIRITFLLFVYNF